MVNGPIFNPREVVSVPVDGDTEIAISSEWAFEHAADLDAHTRNMFEIMRTGEYFTLVSHSGIQDVAVVADTLYASPIFVPRAITLDRIAIRVTIAGAGGTVARLGIYNNGTNLYPGTLLLDAGAVAVDGAVIVAATINLSLTKGIYWAALLSDGAPTCRAQFLNFSPLGFPANTFNVRGRYWSVAQAYGALPDPFTAGGVQVAGSEKSFSYFRLASLD